MKWDIILYLLIAYFIIGLMCAVTYVWEYTSHNKRKKIANNKEDLTIIPLLLLFLWPFALTISTALNFDSINEGNVSTRVKNEDGTTTSEDLNAFVKQTRDRLNELEKKKKTK
jgi:hypothetical protein